MKRKTTNKKAAPKRPRKKKEVAKVAEEPKTIDCTPTWSGLLPWLLSIMQDGNAEGKKVALQQLTRMANVADMYVEYLHGMEDELPDVKARKS